MVCGGSFAGFNSLIANFHGPALVDVVGGLGSLVALAVLLAVLAAGAKSGAFPTSRHATAHDARRRCTRRQIAYAWVPWVLLSVLVFLWGWPSFKHGAQRRRRPSSPTLLAGVSKLTFEVPQLHNHVYRTAPVVRAGRRSRSGRRAGEGRLRTSTGCRPPAPAFSWRRCCRPSGCASAPRDFVRQFVDTLCKMRWALLTIACMLALAFTTKYSGSDATLGLAFTHTGGLYPFFAPLLGWLGVALTGSDTSSQRAVRQLAADHGRAAGAEPAC